MLYTQRTQHSPATGARLEGSGTLGAVMWAAVSQTTSRYVLSQAALVLVLIITDGELLADSNRCVPISEMNISAYFLEIYKLSDVFKKKWNFNRAWKINI